MRGIWGMAFCVLVLGGCAAQPPAPEPRATPSASSPAERDLGPDPGVDGYRTLDLCGLAPATAVEAAYRGEGGSGSVTRTADGPGSCFYGLDGTDVGARLEFTLPRDQLPADVRTTDAGVNKVDETETGVLIYDPSVAFVYVLSPSGYVVRATGRGISVEEQRLTLALAKVARDRLTHTPPKLALPETSVGGVDLCDAVRKADVMGSLGLRGEVRSNVDGRVCELPNGVWVSFYGKAGYPPEFSASKVQIGPATAEVRDSCEMIIPIRPAPKGAGWKHDSLLASSPKPDGPDCDQFIKALVPLVELLA